MPYSFSLLFFSSKYGPQTFMTFLTLEGLLSINQINTLKKTVVNVSSLILEKKYRLEDIKSQMSVSKSRKAWEV